MDNIKETRPWGFYRVIEESFDYKVKYICVSPNQKLSYQKHAQRAEHWFIVSGKALVTINGVEFDLIAGESVSIEIGSLHRIEAVDDIVEFIEIQTGTYFGEDDIIRVEDDYGR